MKGNSCRDEMLLCRDKVSQGREKFFRDRGLSGRDRGALLPTTEPGAHDRHECAHDKGRARDIGGLLRQRFLCRDILRQ